MPAFTSNQFQWDCGHHSEVKVSPFFLKISDRNGEVDTQDKNSGQNQTRSPFCLKFVYILNR